MFRLKSNVRLTRSQWGLVVLLGMLGYYVSSLLDFTGLQYVSAGLERLLLFLYPSFVVFINALVFKQRITGGQKGRCCLLTSALPSPTRAN
ncbi:MAG: EamA family transporter [Hymenobacter sp.]